MAKLSDIAKQAGVSITTASMALSGKGRISDEVRDKVLRIAKDLDYNRTKPGSTAHWTLILNMASQNDHLYHFFNPIIRQIRTSARMNGYSLSILPIDNNSKDDDIFNQIIEIKASSVFTIHFASRSLIEKLERRGILCVIINNSSFQDQFFTICVDDFQGAYEGTVKLIEAGHKNIAYMDYPRRFLPGILADRFFGFRKAIEERGLEYREELKKTINLNDKKHISDSINDLLSASPPPSALFIHDDMLASIVIHQLKEKGIMVPDEISIISPGDTLNYEMSETYQITTMKIDTALMGQYAVNMMIERLQKGEQAPHVLKIKQTYIERKTIRNI